MLYGNNVNFRHRDVKGDPVTYEELTPEHQQKFDEIKALFQVDLIESFERTRHHDIRWKGFSPEGALDGVDLSPRQKSAPKLCAKKSTTWLLILSIGTLRTW
jgi:hypothetical protein